MKSSLITRRAFTKSALAAAVAPLVLTGRARAADITPPSERITIGLVGLGGMGMGHVGRFLTANGSQVVAVCDVHQIHYRDEDEAQGRPRGRDAAKALVEEYYADQSQSGTYKGCDTYADFRELCARDDIDAVVIATPDHWHALIALEALRNGKDVYCEKPVTHLFREGQALVDEIARRKAVFQVGSQQRSDAGFRHAAELVLNGHLGKLTRVEVGLPQGPSEAAGDTTIQDPPANLDYDMWCGPSEKLPYMRARHHRWWRWHLSYGGGNIMDWIGHHNDIAHWGMGVDRSGPVEIEAAGEWTWPAFDGYNAPVDFEIVCRYASGAVSSIGSKNRGGTKWIGEDGWLWVDRGKAEASNPAWLEKGFDPGPTKAYDSRNHADNFLECVRTRKETIAPAEVGHRSITPGHLGYVAQALGRKLQWDPENEAVVGDEEADAVLKRVNYRAPWAL